MVEKENEFFFKNIEKVILDLNEKDDVGDSVFEASVSAIARALDDKYISSLEILPSYFTDYANFENFKKEFNSFTAELNKIIKRKGEDPEQTLEEHRDKLHKLVEYRNKMEEKTYKGILTSRNENRLKSKSNSNRPFGLFEKCSSDNKSVGKESNFSRGKYIFKYYY